MTFRLLPIILTIVCAGCSKTASESSQPAKSAGTQQWFHVDATTAGILKGTIHYTGRKPTPRIIDMDQDLDCAHMHKGGKRPDEDLVVNPNGTLAGVFVYVKSGLEGKAFEPPASPVTIDQKGCWFTPRVLGIQTGQILSVTNSDPVTHNIHPVAQVNREWNHSQAEGDAPLARKFSKPEIMVPVKCNIHRWMHAYIGVLEHPYFAVTGSDGSFEIVNLPPGNYTVAAWQEKLGAQEQPATLAASGKTELSFTFKGE
jgi:plastocyanin